MQLGKRVLIVGSGGKTGIWFSRYLLSLNYQVYALDHNPKVVYPQDLLENKNFKILNQYDFSLQKIDLDWISLSPGVPLSLPIFKEAEEKKIPVISEVEFCSPLLLENFKILGITGTDGKSTTTALLAHFLNSLTIKALACGNFGIPFSQILFEKEKYQKYKYLVAELSSFMLEKSQGLKLESAMYLNLAPDHLDRYPNMASYSLAKWNIYFALKSNGLFLINKNLMPEREKYLGPNHPLVITKNDKNIIEIDTENLVSPNFYWENKVLYYKKNNTKICQEAELLLRGDHNAANILFVLENYLSLFGKEDLDNWRQALLSFKPLPHRFEILPSFSQNVYINDSKATTTQATLTALKNVVDPVFLFLGGRGKGEDYTHLIKEISHRQVTCFLYGEERENLKKLMEENNIPYFLAETLKDVFFLATQEAKKNSSKKFTFLLSPAMTSWDQYANYEERGNHFRELVKAYENSLNP